MDYQNTRILITVRAYPVPSKKYVETSCVAGLDLQAQKPIRIFPVRARVLNDSNQFQKWSIISARIKKAKNDHRPESHNIDQSSIVVESHVGTRNGWTDRNNILRPFRSVGSIEELLAQNEREGKHNAPSLALIRPKSIRRLLIEHKGREDWTADEVSKLRQQDMFDIGTCPRQQLQFVPYTFKYHFYCDDKRCDGHILSVIDWEVGQSYRKWRREYGANDWEMKFREKYWNELANERALQFFVGTQHKRPRTWSIIGLYYPPKYEQPHTRALPLVW